MTACDRLQRCNYGAKEAITGQSRAREGEFRDTLSKDTRSGKICRGRESLLDSISAAIQKMSARMQRDDDLRSSLLLFFFRGYFGRGGQPFAAGQTMMALLAFVCRGVIDQKNAKCMCVCPRGNCQAITITYVANC